MQKKHIISSIKVITHKVVPPIPDVHGETKAILPNGAPDEWNKPFLNMVVYGSCLVSPEELLKGFKQIEYDIGRTQVHEKWAPRVIDLDILLWDNLILNTPYLTIPHPELMNRPFLLHL
ncbi:unnamed protein product, partial [Onchocerca ochengi]|uniref:2-amino-4-hydroxy-6-hydroxymethyldihydropteridine diphosphokinase n=1 Tax=Onchocerca ochengi TaxID=42157 RepID=A0A182EXT3_ONCOC